MTSVTRHNTDCNSKSNLLSYSSHDSEETNINNGLNYSYSKGKLETTNRSNSCPVCDDTTGKCRINSHSDNGYVQCMTLVDVIKGQSENGYTCIGTTKDGMWGQFIPNEEYYKNKPQQQQLNPTQARLLLKAKVEAKKAKAQQEIKTEAELSLDRVTRHENYTRLLSELTLDDRDKADLIRRGYTQLWIELSGVKSVSRYQDLEGTYHKNLPGINANNQICASRDGVLLPISDYDGYIIGCQLRVRELGYGESNRYYWLSSGKGSDRPLKLAFDGLLEEPTLELPLAIFKPEKPELIAIVEGVGAKPFLTSQRLNALTIGAAGGLFMSSQNQLINAIKQARLDYGNLPVVVYPDAGDVNNPMVMERWGKVSEFLKKCEIVFNFGWWDQILKSADDIDELTVEKLSEIKLISPSEFLKKSGFETDKPVNTKDLLLWKNNKKFNPDITLKVGYDEFSFDMLPLQDNAVFLIKGLEGVGKSEAGQDYKIKRLKEDGIDSVSTTFRRKLAKQELNALEAKGGNAYRLNDVDDNTAMMIDTHFVGCTESLHKMSGRLSNKDFFSDEFSAVKRQICDGGTKKGAERANMIEDFKQAVTDCKRAFLLDADLSNNDVELIKELAPNKKIIRVLVELEKPRTRNITIVQGYAIDENDEIVIKKRDQSCLIKKALRKDEIPFIVTDTQGTKIEKELLEAGKVGFLINHLTCLKKELPGGGSADGETWEALFERVPEAKERWGHLLNCVEYKLSWVEDLYKDTDHQKAFFNKFKPDYIIGSPTISAGFSCKVQGYFTSVIALFCGVVRVPLLTQALFRLRDSVDIFVAIPEFSTMGKKQDFFNDYYNNDLGKLINEFQVQNMELIDNENSLEIFNMALGRINQPFAKASLLELLLDKFERQHYLACFVYAVRQKGHNVKFLDELVDGRIIQNQKDLTPIQRIEVAQKTSAAYVYATKEEADKAHEKRETVETYYSAKRAYVLDKLPGIDDAINQVVTQEIVEIKKTTNGVELTKDIVLNGFEFFLFSFVLKDRGFISGQSNFYLLHNLDVAKKLHEKSKYTSLTNQFVDGDSLIDNRYAKLLKLDELGIPALIKYLEDGGNITKLSPEVVEITAKARKDRKINVLAGFKPKEKTPSKNENMDFIKSLLKYVGKELEYLGKVTVNGVRCPNYALKDKTIYHELSATATAQYWEDWIKEVYEVDKPDWAYSKDNQGARKPKDNEYGDEYRGDEVSFYFDQQSQSLKPMVVKPQSQVETVETVPTVTTAKAIQDTSELPLEDIVGIVEAMGESPEEITFIGAVFDLLTLDKKNPMKEAFPDTYNKMKDYSERMYPSC